MLADLFIPIPGVQSYQFFRFRRTHPGHDQVKAQPRDDWTDVVISKGASVSADLPAVIPDCGLKTEKRVLFYKSYSPHIPKDRPEVVEQFYYAKPEAEASEELKMLQKDRKNAKIQMRAHAVQRCTPLSGGDIEDKITTSVVFVGDRTEAQSDTTRELVETPSTGIRKRGRPPGSKNKLKKLFRANDEENMPPNVLGTH